MFEILAGVSDDEEAKITVGNTARVYNLDVARLTVDGEEPTRLRIDELDVPRCPQRPRASGLGSTRRIWSPLLGLAQAHKFVSRTWKSGAEATTPGSGVGIWPATGHTDRRSRLGPST